MHFGPVKCCSLQAHPALADRKQTPCRTLPVSQSHVIQPGISPFMNKKTEEMKEMITRVFAGNVGNRDDSCWKCLFDPFIHVAS